MRRIIGNHLSIWSAIFNVSFRFHKSMSEDKTLSKRSVTKMAGHEGSRHKLLYSRKNGTIGNKVSTGQQPHVQNEAQRTCQIRGGRSGKYPYIPSDTWC